MTYLSLLRCRRHSARRPCWRDILNEKHRPYLGTQEPGQALLHRLMPEREPVLHEVLHAFHHAQVSSDSKSILFCPMQMTRIRRHRRQNLRRPGARA